MPERKVGGVDDTPITTYWQYKLPDEDADIKPETREKIKKITKGQEWKGTYLMAFKRVDKDDKGNEKITYTHLLKLENGKKETIKGSTGLNRDLALLGTGKTVRIVFLGTGKKKPMKKPPFIFDVFEVLPDAPTPSEDDAEELETATNVAATEPEAEESEEFDSEIPF